ncbi:MAG: precorrin-6y C5,15-methyltransferase (decarboxylating) subunit CbiE [Candidatus Brocadiia bacterium]
MSRNASGGVTIAGCGPGGRDFLTPAAEVAVQEADVLFGAPRLLEMFPDVGVETHEVSAPLSGVLDRLEERLAGGSRAVVLVTGDPGMHSFAGTVCGRVGRENCRIIPGISSVQAAFAALRLKWENVRVVSAHHRQPEVNAAELAGEDRIAVLAGSEEGGQWLRRTAGALESHRCFVCENLTLPDERVYEVEKDRTDRLFPAARSVVIFVRKEILR